MISNQEQYRCRFITALAGNYSIIYRVSPTPGKLVRIYWFLATWDHNAVLYWNASIFQGLMELFRWEVIPGPLPKGTKRISQHVPVESASHLVENNDYTKNVLYFAWLLAYLEWSDTNLRAKEEPIYHRQWDLLCNPYSGTTLRLPPIQFTSVNSQLWTNPL